MTGIVGYAETGDTRFISTAGDAAYVVIELDLTDEESVEVVDDIRAAIVAAGRLQLPADRLRPDHQGLGRAVREGPPEGRARLAPDRGARPDPRLRLARRGRHAAPRRRPGDPEQPRAHLPRRPAGRDEHLRAQHRDDARARPGDRLLAVHRQPLPRGAAARPDGRRGGRTGRRHGRQGRRVQRHRGRHRAVRAAAVRGAGHPLDRHRRRARRPLLGRLRPDLPAGRARDARASASTRCRSAACAAASGRSPTVSSRRGRARWERVAHAVMRRPIAVLVPTLAFLLLAGSPVPAPRAGRPGRRDLPARRREPRRLRRAPDRVRARRDDADRHPRRRRGLADRPRQHPGARPPTPRSSTALEGIDRVESPFAIPDPATGALLHARRGRRALRAPGRPAAARARRAARPLRPRLHGPARRDQPAPAVPARSDRPDPGHPRHRRRVPGSRPRSAAARRSATTSSSRRPSARRTPSG